MWLLCRYVRSASTRETLWKVALIAPLITTTVQMTVDFQKPTPMQIELPSLLGEAGSQPAVNTPRRAESPPLHQTRFSLASLYVAATALLLLRLILGRAWFAYSLRRRVDLIREHERLARLRAAMSCRAEIRLTESDAVGSPIAMSGWEVVVPRGTFSRLTDDQKDTILAHEIAHLQRRDPLWLLFSELVKALLFVQPLNWLVQKKMKECAEFLCDDIAVAHTGDPKALAETLAELATSIGPTPRAVAAMAEGGSNLMARVTRVLHARPERPLRLALRIGIAVTTVVALAAFGPAFASKKSSTSSRVDLTNRDVELSHDGSWVQFNSRDAYLRLRKTTPTQVLEIEVTPSSKRFRVDGVEKPWSDEARLIVVSALQPSEPESAIEVTPLPRRADPARKLKTWNATVSLTGSRDHVPTSLSVKAEDVRYDTTTGEVFFDGDARLDVEERHGAETRTFHRDKDQVIWSGEFGQQEVGSWLVRILHEQAKIPANVAEALAKP